MKTVARMLELSVASNVPEFGRQETRRRDLMTINNPAKRLAALTIDELAARQPKLAMSTLSGLSRVLAHLRFIGQGSVYSVYGNENDVIKVHRDSSGWTEEKRQTYIKTEALYTRQLCSVMGSMAISQKYRIGHHPLGRYRVVVAEQTFVRGSALPIFNTNQPHINEPVVAEYCETVFGGEEALMQVVQATHELYDLEGLVPDTNGAGNLVMAGDYQALTMIDPQPVVDPPTTSLIRRQVDNLATFLEAA